MATPQAGPPPADTPTDHCAHYFVWDAAHQTQFCAKCGKLASKPVIRLVRLNTAS
jgi:hypothetical protein